MPCCGSTRSSSRTTTTGSPASPASTTTARAHPSFTRSPMARPVLNTPSATLAQPRLPRLDDALRAGGDAELGEDVGDVVAHGLLAEGQAAGDGVVVEAAGDEVEDLALAIGQLGERAGPAAPGAPVEL